MSSFHHTLTRWGSLAVILLVVSPLLAQSEPSSGLIRITDKSTANFAAQTSTVSQTRAVSHCQSCNNHGYTQTGHCQSGNCPNYNSYNHCPNCYGHKHWMMGPHMAGLCYGCTRSPGTGYIPPGRIPVQRQPIGYTQWYPSYWSGMGYGNQVPVNPAVAVPTDTTQLGYYYNHVPTWQPKPHMIPSIPNPDDWHVRRCGNNNCFGNVSGNCQHAQTSHNTIINQGTNLTPVPEHFEQSVDPHEVLNKNTQPAPKVGNNDTNEPLAFFPDLAPTSTSNTQLISFPELDAVNDVDADE